MGTEFLNITMTSCLIELEHLMGSSWCIFYDDVTCTMMMTSLCVKVCVDDGFR